MQNDLDIIITANFRIKLKKRLGLLRFYTEKKPEQKYYARVPFKASAILKRHMHFHQQKENARLFAGMFRIFFVLFFKLIR